MKKKLIAVLLAATVSAAIALPACSNGGDGSQDTNTPNGVASAEEFAKITSDKITAEQWSEIFGGDWFDGCKITGTQDDTVIEITLAKKLIHCVYSTNSGTRVSESYYDLAGEEDMVYMKDYESGVWYKNCMNDNVIMVDYTYKTIAYELVGYEGGYDGELTFNDVTYSEEKGGYTYSDEKYDYEFVIKFQNGIYLGGEGKYGEELNFGYYYTYGSYEVVIPEEVKANAIPMQN